MEHLAALFSGFGPWNWFFLVVVLFLLDTIVPGVHFLWFRIAAVGAGVLSLATGIAWQWQIVAFGVFSVAAALWVRRFAQPDVMKSDMPDLNARGRQYIGRSLMVEEAIECGRGKVRVGDTLWPAEGPDAPVGASVTVTGARGTALMVDGAPTGVPRL
jgi:membrane protein implicated in regulation of membrane protease activity